MPFLLLGSVLFLLGSGRRGGDYRNRLALQQITNAGANSTFYAPAGPDLSQCLSDFPPECPELRQCLSELDELSETNVKIVAQLGWLRATAEKTLLELKSEDPAQFVVDSLMATALSNPLVPLLVDYLYVGHQSDMKAATLDLVRSITTNSAIAAGTYAAHAAHATTGAIVAKSALAGSLVGPVVGLIAGCSAAALCIIVGYATDPVTDEILKKLIVPILFGRDGSIALDLALCKEKKAKLQEFISHQEREPPGAQNETAATKAELDLVEW
eukprot:CAMPEP_0117601144 /NCGR_PEP_ID=MMETSP0784-20121206/76871_1 /TAXON_ID=39447 /ORGANISM="" /LENGTH=270 /DNA_ID=CAMNT_0005403837 /DNA_START=96 /DNA_END=905 /DNA_ORIENTATION=-